MRMGIFKVIAIVGLALVFNACGSRIDESVQGGIEEKSSVHEDRAQANKTDVIDTFIEGKINSGGVLSLTEYEFSREVASRIVERRITFTITHLSDRDKTIDEMQKILKDQGETYRVVKEDRPGVMEVITNTAVGAVDGATIGGAGGTFIFPGIGSFLGGAIGGAIGGVGSLAYSLKDYIGDVFAKDTNWLISKSLDESVLNILFVKE